MSFLSLHLLSHTSSRRRVLTLEFSMVTSAQGILSVLSSLLYKVPPHLPSVQLPCNSHLLISILRELCPTNLKLLMCLLILELRKHAHS